VQFEPPDDLDVIDEVAAMGIDSVGIHMETFDPPCWRGWPRQGPHRDRALLRGLGAARSRLRRGQVSTYVILGMGEDPS
jgi:hypothetical protein